MDIDNDAPKTTAWELRDDSISKHILSGVTPKGVIRTS